MDGWIGRQIGQLKWFFLYIKRAIGLYYPISGMQGFNKSLIKFWTTWAERKGTVLAEDFKKLGAFPQNIKSSVLSSLFRTFKIFLFLILIWTLSSTEITHYFYNKVTGCLSVCLYRRISLTGEPIWFSFTGKLLIGPGKVFNYFGGGLIRRN